MELKQQTIAINPVDRTVLVHHLPLTSPLTADEQTRCALLDDPTLNAMLKKLACWPITIPTPYRPDDTIDRTELFTQLATLKSTTAPAQIQEHVLEIREVLSLHEAMDVLDEMRETSDG